MIGHYTAIVWAGTTHVGCGKARCPGDGGDIITCNYFPPGNYEGERPYKTDPNECGNGKATSPPTVPTNPPTNPSTNPSTSPPTKPPTNPPTNPPTKPPTNPPTSPPTNPPTSPPTNPPTCKPTTGENGGKFTEDQLREIFKSELGKNRVELLKQMEDVLTKVLNTNMGGYDYQ